MNKSNKPAGPIGPTGFTGLSITFENFGPLCDIAVIENRWNETEATYIIAVDPDHYYTGLAKSELGRILASSSVDLALAGALKEFGVPSGEALLLSLDLDAISKEKAY